MLINKNEMHFFIIKEKNEFGIEFNDRTYELIQNWVNCYQTNVYKNFMKFFERNLYYIYKNELNFDSLAFSNHSNNFNLKFKFLDDNFYFALSDQIENLNVDLNNLEIEKNELDNTKIDENSLNIDEN
jgi:hypothetical protein